MKRFKFSPFKFHLFSARQALVRWLMAPLQLLDLVSWLKLLAAHRKCGRELSMARAENYSLKKALENCRRSELYYKKESAHWQWETMELLRERDK